MSQRMSGNSGDDKAERRRVFREEEKLKAVVKAKHQGKIDLLKELDEDTRKKVMDQL